MSGDVGRRLADRYLLLEELGSGGMGTVWRARDETLDREVAVKELRIAGDLDDAAKEEAGIRAVREAQAAAGLRHPGIIVVHDAFLADGRPWIIMQLLDGGSLDRVLAARGALPADHVARIGVDVLDALAAAHAAGVLHRDIKPGNIFLTADGRAVVTDFGIATVEGQATITRSGMLVGSPGYVAPERLRGERPGPPSDLWSLAATLYRAVEGHHPFPGDSHVAVLAAVLTADPVPPVRAGELGPLLTHLLARDPRARPEPPVARRALERVAAGEPSGDIAPPPAPAPAPPTAPAALPRRRTRLGTPRALLAGCVALTVALALTAVLVVATDDRTPAAVAAGPSAAPSSTAPPAAPPSPAADGARFTVPIDVCALVPVAKVREIIPRYTRPEGKPAGGTDAPSCSWDAAGAGIEVAVRREYGSPDPWSATTPERAHESYLTFLRAEDGSDKIIWHYDGIGGESITSGPATKAEPVPDLGEEAFTTDTYGRLGAQMTEVVFRVSNLVLEVTHADVTNKTGADGIRRNAVRMARWVAEALDER